MKEIDPKILHPAVKDKSLSRESIDMNGPNPLVYIPVYIPRSVVTSHATG